MKNKPNATLHPDDADMVRWIDNALPADERASFASHLAGCVRCGTRHAALARRAARVSELLRAADLPAPATRLRITIAAREEAIPRWWRMAAAIAVLIGAAAAVPPVRAWIATAARAAWELATGAPAPAPVVPVAEVGFVPAGPAVTIRVPARSTGNLTVETVAGERVTMVEAGGHDLPQVTVLPDELRIGEGDSAARYVVRVPLTLQAVRVQVGTNAAEVFRPSVAGERRVFAPK